MRKSNIIYLVWLLGTIGIIYGIVHYGKRLQAPVALPKLWSLQTQSSCPLFSQNESSMSLAQSGETLELVLLESPPFSLHGKLMRDGTFRFSGEARGLATLGCKKANLLWEGRASRDSIEGTLKVEGPACPVCQEPIRITGRPQAQM